MMLDNIKLVVKQFNLNMKFMISNKTNIILCFFIIASSLFIATIFIPLWVGGGLVYEMSLLSICGITYASIQFNVRKSTIYANISLTKNNRWTFNAGILISMILVGFIVSLTIFLALTFLNAFELVMVEWFDYSSHIGEPDNKYYVMDISLFLICMYVTLLSVLLIFAISFMINHLISTQQVYFIIIITLIILMIIFGGTFNDYFGEGEFGVINLQHPLFPWELFWLGISQPFFGTSNLINVAYEARIIRFVQNTETGIWNWVGGDKELFTYLIFNKENPLIWKIQNVIPYVEIVGFLGAGVVISKIYNNK